jgi:hypothetical protein
MPRSIEPLHTRRAAQLKALVQARNTLPPRDRYTVMDLFDACRCAAGLDTSRLHSGSLELIDTLAGRYLQEVAS